MSPPSLMAVGAHADDIEFNVGGTLAKYVNRGYRAVYVMSTNNMSGNWCYRNADGTIRYTRPGVDVIMPQRKLEAAAAAAAFKTEAIHLDHPQRHYTRADGSVVELSFGCERTACVPPGAPTILTAHEDDAAVQHLADLILEHQPEAILTHGMPMANIEHVGTCMLVTKAYRRAATAGYAGLLLFWKDIGVDLFGKAYDAWDTFVDVSDHWQEKIDALALHACQIPDVSRMTFPVTDPACGCRRAEVFLRIYPDAWPQPDTAFAAEIVAHAKPSHTTPNSSGSTR